MKRVSMGAIKHFIETASEKEKRQAQAWINNELAKVHAAERKERQTKRQKIELGVEEE